MKLKHTSTLVRTEHSFESYLEKKVGYHYRTDPEIYVTIIFENGIFHSYRHNRDDLLEAEKLDLAVAVHDEVQRILTPLPLGTPPSSA